MITLTPLEWRGFEVAVAEMLELAPGCARMLRLFCQAAPLSVSSETLRRASAYRSAIEDDTTGNGVAVRTHKIRRALSELSSLLSTRISQSREALSDVGIPVKIGTAHGYGYGMSSEDAEVLVLRVLEYVGQTPDRDRLARTA